MAGAGMSALVRFEITNREGMIMLRNIWVPACLALAACGTLPVLPITAIRSTTPPTPAQSPNNPLLPPAGPVNPNGQDPNAVAVDPNAPKITDPGTAGDGNYIIGPDFADAPETKVDNGVPQGTVTHFTMDSSDSKIFNGLDPTLTTPAQFTRDLWLYVPKQYVAGTPSPFMVVQDGGGYLDLATVADNLIAAKKIPVMLILFINPGPGDGRGSERGLEYDTVSDAYVRFIEGEVLPKVAASYNVKFTPYPEGRGAMGGSSGGAAAFTMAWFQPDSYRRVLTYSGTFVNQHPDATYPHGAWTYHESLIANTAPKPIRVFIEAGTNDNNLDAVFGDGMHNWQVANEHMSNVLTQQKYHYRFLEGIGAGHVDGRVVNQTLPESMEWLWRGYPID